VEAGDGYAEQEHGHFEEGNHFVLKGFRVHVQSKQQVFVRPKDPNLGVCVCVGVCVWQDWSKLVESNRSEAGVAENGRSIKVGEGRDG
jgi:hypothetical protein